MSVQMAPKKAILSVAASRGDIEKPYLEACDRVFDENGSEPDWLKKLRRAGKERFKAHGFPHRRVEAWKYTDLRPRMKAPFSLALGQETPQTIVATAFEGISASRLIINDGVFAPSLSSLMEQSGVELVSLKQSLHDLPDWVKDYLELNTWLTSSPMPALGAALMQDALFMRIAKDAVLDRPLHVIYQTTANAAHYHTKCVVILEQGAKATLIESHVSENEQASFHNQGIEIEVGDDACLDHIVVEGSAEENLHVTSLNARLAQRARYTAMSAVSGGGLVRGDSIITLEGKGALAQVNGVYMLVGRQHCDNTIVIKHAAPDCESAQVFQGVLTENSRGVFQGKVIVAEGADGTDAHQLSRALLLSDKAEADSKPELEIYADDVKCSHGATIGELDKDSLFYLRSRGIPLGEAKALLIEAFLDDVVEGAATQELIAPVKKHISNWLKEHESQIMQEGLKT